MFRLYYTWAVDSIILTTLNAIAMQQAAPTQETMEEVKQFLDYCSSQEEAVITYHASDMVLAMHSDARYLNEQKFCIVRWERNFYLSSDVPYTPINGTVLNIAKVLDTVMSSAAEAELGVLFSNAQEAVHLRRMLAKMGHKQPKTPIQMNNSTAEGVINATVQPK